MVNSLICTFETPLGEMVARFTDNALTELRFTHPERGPVKCHDVVNMTSTEKNFLRHPVLSSLHQWLTEYFTNNIPQASVSLAPQGTLFQQKVWNQLKNIPYGQVTSYGNIAQRLSALENEKRVSARAVGNAIGRNPIALLIPCHRVVGMDKRLIGYAWGLERKRYLLNLERCPRA